MFGGQRQPPVNLDFAGLSAGFGSSDVQCERGASPGVVRRYLYLASFLQGGVSCGILEPFFQDQVSAVLPSAVPLRERTTTTT